MLATLRATQMQAPTITGVAPLFGTQNLIEPGEWVTIYGQNLASQTASWNSDFPTSLGGTTVTIDGKAAYLSYVSPTQLNLQAPRKRARDLPLNISTRLLSRQLQDCRFVEERALRNDKVARRESVPEDKAETCGLYSDIEYLVNKNTLAGPQTSRQPNVFRTRCIPSSLSRG